MYLLGAYFSWRFRIQIMVSCSVIGNIDTYNKRFGGSLGQGGQTNIHRSSNTDIGCIMTKH